VVCNWGLVLVVQADNTVVCLKEKELNSKLELLYNKSLYLLALNLAQSHQVQLRATTPYRRNFSVKITITTVTTVRFLAHGEFSTCRESLVSPEQPVLCIPVRPDC